MTKDETARTSRRAVVRAAAWTAPAVVMVVAAPAYATTAQSTLGSIVASGTISGVNQSKTYTWTLTIQADRAIPAGQLVLSLTGMSSVGSLAVTSGTTTWSGSGGSSRAYPSALTTGQQLEVKLVIIRGNNSSGTATATFTAPPLSGSFETSQPF